MNNHRDRYYSGLGIYNDPLKLKENETSRVASVSAQEDPNFSQIMPDSPKNTREQTPYPSPQLSSSSDKDSSENISRSSSPGVSLAEIALAMEVNGQKNNGELVQKYFIPQNLGIKNR
jgi:hypothetical protein